MAKLNPQLPADEVKYLPKNVYTTDDMMLDIDTGSKLDIYGNVYLNGVRIDARLPTVNLYPSGDTTGATDTAAFNAITGPVKIILGPGTFYMVNATIRTGMHVQGSGKMNTIVKQPNGVNAQVFLSEGWAGLQGGISSGGPTDWSVIDLTVDVNAANNLTSGWGFLIYAWRYVIDNVDIINIRTGGINSEWGTASGPRMDARLINVNITATVAFSYGIVWNGPHDSMLEGCVINGGGASPASGSRAFWFGAKSGGTRLHDCHAWSVVEWTVEIVNSVIWFNQCYLEGGRTGQLWVNGGSVQYHGGVIFGNDTTGVYGIMLGGSASANGCDIDTTVWGCPGGAIRYIDQISNSIKLHVIRTASEPIEAGTANNVDWSDYDIQVENGTADSTERMSVRRRLVVYNRHAASPVITAIGNPSQAGPMHSWQNSSGVEMLAVQSDGTVLFKEAPSTPAAPAADKAVLYLQDNGSGKSQLVMRFATGGGQVIATQP